MYFVLPFVRSIKDLIIAAAKRQARTSLSTLLSPSPAQMVRGTSFDDEDEGDGEDDEDQPSYPPCPDRPLHSADQIQILPRASGGMGMLRYV